MNEPIDGFFAADLKNYKASRGNEELIKRLAEISDEAELVAIVERLYDILLQKYGRRLFL